MSYRMICKWLKLGKKKSHNSKFELFLENIRLTGVLPLQKFLKSLLLAEQIRSLNAPIYCQSQEIRCIRSLYDFYPFMVREFDYKNHKLPVVDIDFQTSVVFTSPWNFDRLVDAYCCIGEGLSWGVWKEDPNNHVMDLYFPLNLVITSNGYHSTTQGIVLNQGTATPMEHYDLRPIVEQVTCDGSHYRRRDTNAIVASVENVEWANIYRVLEALVEALAQSEPD